MSKSRTLGVMSMLFAVISAMFASAGQPYGGSGFAIAAGLAGLFAGWRSDDGD